MFLLFTYIAISITEYKIQKDNYMNARERIKMDGYIIKVEEESERKERLRKYLKRSFTPIVHLKNLYDDIIDKESFYKKVKNNLTEKGKTILIESEKTQEKTQNIELLNEKQQKTYNYTDNITNTTKEKEKVLVKTKSLR